MKEKAQAMFINKDLLFSGHGIIVETWFLAQARQVLNKFEIDI